jgi:hypothetical protein
MLFYVKFYFMLNLIWLLLHCNAMHFDSFSLGARHLFQKLVLFFFIRGYTCDIQGVSETTFLSAILAKNVA